MEELSYIRFLINPFSHLYLIQKETLGTFFLLIFGLISYSLIFELFLISKYKVDRFREMSFFLRLVFIILVIFPPSLIILLYISNILIASYIIQFLFGVDLAIFIFVFYFAFSGLIVGAIWALCWLKSGLELKWSLFHRCFIYGLLFLISLLSIFYAPFNIGNLIKDRNLEEGKIEYTFNCGNYINKYFNREDQVVIKSDSPFEIQFRDGDEVSEKVQAKDVSDNYYYEGKPLIPGEPVLFLSKTEQIFYNDWYEWSLELKQGGIKVTKGDTIYLKSNFPFKYILGVRSEEVQADTLINLWLYEKDENDNQELWIFGNGEQYQTVLITGYNDYQAIYYMIMNLLGYWLGYILLFYLMYRIIKSYEQRQKHENSDNEINQEDNKMQANSENALVVKVEGDLDSLITKFGNPFELRNALQHYKAMKHVMRGKELVDKLTEILESVNNHLQGQLKLYETKNRMEAEKIRSQYLSQIIQMEELLKVELLKSNIEEQRQKQDTIKVSGETDRKRYQEEARKYTAEADKLEAEAYKFTISNIKDIIDIHSSRQNKKIEEMMTKIEQELKKKNFTDKFKDDLDSFLDLSDHIRTKLKNDIGFANDLINRLKNHIYEHEE